MRGVRERVADVDARRGPGEGGAIVGRGVEEEHARRPRHAVGQARPGGRLRPSELDRREQRREVLAGVVPAGVDEVALGQPEPLALRPAVGAATGRPDDLRAAAPDGQKANAGRGANGTTWIRSRRRWSRRRADAAVASLPDDHRGGIAQEPAAQALAEPRRRRPLVRPGSSHGARSSSVTTTGRPVTSGTDAADRVVDRPGRAARGRPPRRADAGAAQDDRVDREGRRAEQVGGRQQPPADDLEVREGDRRIVEVRAEQQGERLARERRRVVRARAGPAGRPR